MLRAKYTEPMMQLICYMMLIGCLLCCGVGCQNSNEAVEGKVKITSTKVFGNTKALKSPPPQAPGK